MMRKCVKIFKFAFLLSFIYLFFNSRNNNSSSSKSVLNTKLSTSVVVKEKKYITCTVNEGGGLGNQIWRFASLYGIARFTKRLPYFEINQFQTPFTKTNLKLTNLSEIAEIFPSMHEALHIKASPPSQTRNINFAEDCCKYEYPITISNISEKFLKISGNYLHAYRFFDSHKTEIQQLLECGPSIMTIVNKLASTLFNDDKSFKLCVHIRRGDFINDPMLESKKDFIVPAISYVQKYLTNLEKINNLSLVFMGDDVEFMNDLLLKDVIFNQMYIPDTRKPRGEDLCFGINYCDGMLMTASASTFSWWISYLMKSNGPVFYNSQISKSRKESKDIHDYHLFLPEWISLRLKNDQIFEDTQWWHEKLGLNLSAPKKIRKKSMTNFFKT